MKFHIIFFILNGLLIEVLSWEIAKVLNEKPICSWVIYRSQYKCSNSQFQCINTGNCISRSWYCDRANDCGDNSDEKYCGNSYSSPVPCPTNPLFAKCESSSKCIPYDWICNGYSDCPSGDDEYNCGSFSSGRNSSVTRYINTNPALNNITQWLDSQKLESSAAKWGPNIHQLALLFYFANENFILKQSNATKNEIAYELKIQLLSRLISQKIEDIPSTELASYLNAFLLTCIDPRNFNEFDIVQELRNRVDRENYTNPYSFLALCNAGEPITESDVQKLMEIFWAEHRTFWTDVQAVVVMTLACASKQPGNEVDLEVVREMTLKLKEHQFSNGSVVNLPTTALVLQALIATETERDPDGFDEVKALEGILQSQELDGSFGDLTSTLLVTPVLSCKSLVDINSDHCHYQRTNEISALESLSRKPEPKIPVQYTLWIGNKKDIERNLILRVPQSMSLYGVMEIAAEVDNRFKFDYSVKNRKPYINAVSGMRDNPLTGKFWFLYVVRDGELTLLNESPAEVIPGENDHYALWYRRGSWVN